MKTEGNDLMHPFEETDTGGNHYHTHYGLTKREYFAVMAMQGMMSYVNTPMPPSEICEEAVRLSGALIEALNKQ